MPQLQHFTARAGRAAFVRSRNKRTPYISVMFVVLEGPQRGSEYEWQGYLTAATIARTAQSLRLCGCALPGGDITDLSGLGTKNVDISVGESAFGMRVEWINELRERLSDAERSQLAESFSGAVIDALEEPSEDETPI